MERQILLPVGYLHFYLLLPASFITMTYMVYWRLFDIRIPRIVGLKFISELNHGIKCFTKSESIRNRIFLCYQNVLHNYFLVLNLLSSVMIMKIVFIFCPAFLCICSERVLRSFSDIVQLMMLNALFCLTIVYIQRFAPLVSLFTLLLLFQSKY